METMKLLLLVIVFLPPLAFLAAGVMELRSDQPALRKLGKLIPAILGLAVFTLFLNPQFFLDYTVSSSILVCRVMTLISAVIASSGAFVSYSRRGSSALIAGGGLVMAFFWMFSQVRI
jgi:hypothetical protein